MFKISKIPTFICFNLAPVYAKKTKILKRSHFLFRIPMGLINRNGNMWEEQGWNKQDVRRRG